jgi:endonuclease-3
VVKVAASSVSTLNSGAAVKELDAQQVEQFFSTLQAANPEPTTELQYSTTFELLVAVVLSAQATDVSVNKATPGLFAVVHGPKDVLALGQAGLEKHIKTIGLYRNKAKHLIQTSQILIDRFGGQVPRTREELESLPGVGRKTANVILNVAFGEPTMAVDTHIFRVANRTGLAAGKTPEAVEQGLLKCVPPQYLGHAHHWLILLGRYVCTALSPKCSECPVVSYCNYPDKKR